MTEELGGDVLAVEVSANKKTNLDKLEEAILLQAEVLDLKANPDRPAEGVVIEARIEQGRGSVATVLVQKRHAAVGDLFVAGAEWGRVRALIDDRGNTVDARRRRPCRSRCWASKARRRRATISSWSTAKRGPAKSPTTASAANARSRRRPVCAARSTRCSRRSPPARRRICRS